MESATAYLEDIRVKMAVAALAGGVALTASGCTSPEGPQAEQTAEATPPAVVYETDPGTDELPRVSQYDYLSSPTSTTYVNPNTYDMAIKYGGSDDESKGYSFHFNSDDNEATKEHDLPAYKSAPLLDVVLGTDGELRYRDFTESTDTSGEDANLLKAVSAASPILLPAMRSGDVHAVHFRLFESGQYPENPEWEPTVTAQYVPEDHNDNGRPSIYYYLPADSRHDTETVKVELGHEAAHSMLEQFDQNSEEIPITESERALLVEACGILRKEALQKVYESDTFILSDLITMRDMSKPEYRESYNKVIRALDKNKYDTLPTEYEGDVPECYTQTPWNAVIADARNKKLGSDRLKPGVDEEEFESIANEMVEEWNDLLKQGTVYSILSESMYLKDDDEHSVWGHPYENYNELSASSTNLAMNVPEQLGENIADLPEEQRSVITRLITFNFQKLKDSHPKEIEFHKYLDTQLATLMTASR